MKKSPQDGIFRIVDANLNRAKEALRVCEDIIRFMIDDKKLTSEFKAVRHQLTQIILNSDFHYKNLLKARNSARDVGKRGLILDRKHQRRCLDVLIANLKRTQEALRVLEECAKLTSPAASKKIQKLRFQSYELERRSILKF